MNISYSVQLNRVSKSFIHNGKRELILNQIEGAVKTGSILTILGPSGSGKSTILSLCNLLLTPDEGEVFIEDKEVRSWNIAELRRTVGIAFQNAPMIQGTVLDNLLLPAKLHNQQEEHPEEYLKQVGLPESMLTKNVHDLSGGQRQRLALARTLVNNPSILLLDEITSALDPHSVREVEELILDIHQERGTSIMWVTHDMEQARRVGDEAWLVVEGEIIEKRPTDEFFQDPRHELTKQFLSKGMMVSE